jgi:FlaA1/EpsC-like NDP-sugar epimerase
LGLVSPSSVGAEISQTSKVEKMLDFVAKYGKNFAVHQGRTALPAKDTVLVTGTTGAIGSAVLAELAKSTKVARVYALNRKGTTLLAERQKKALEDRGLDPAIADSPDVVLVEADLAQPNLGVSKELLEEVRFLFYLVSFVDHDGLRRFDLR